jgi:hypothetical protein
MLPLATWLGPAGWYHLLVFGLLVPAMAVRSWFRLRNLALPLPNRLRHFRATGATLVALTGLSLWVAYQQDITLFPWRLPPLGAVSAGVAMYIAAVAFMRPRWRLAVERRVRVVYLFMPDNAAERAWWAAVSILAGVGEEITWRGVQTTLLGALVGHYAIAAVLCAVSFGLGHFHQGLRSAAIIAVFALWFQAIVWLEGGLYVAMAVHLAYDITAGLTYGRLGRRLGYTLDPAAAASKLNQESR